MCDMNLFQSFIINLFVVVETSKIVPQQRVVLTKGCNTTSNRGLFSPIVRKKLVNKHVRKVT